MFLQEQSGSKTLGFSPSFARTAPNSSKCSTDNGMPQDEKPPSQRLFKSNNSSNKTALNLSMQGSSAALSKPDYSSFHEQKYTNDIDLEITLGAQSLSSSQVKLRNGEMSSYHDEDKARAKRRRGRPKRDPSEGWPKRPLSVGFCRSRVIHDSIKTIHPQYLA